MTSDLSVGAEEAEEEGREEEAVAAVTAAVSSMPKVSLVKPGMEEARRGSFLGGREGGREGRREGALEMRMEFSVSLCPSDKTCQASIFSFHPPSLPPSLPPPSLLGDP